MHENCVNKYLNLVTDSL